MNKLIIIRGPAGIGKTTIGKILAKNIDADFIVIDKILKDNKLDYIEGDKWIPLEKYQKSNKILLPILKQRLKERSVVIEQCFYHKEHLEEIIKEMKKIINEKNIFVFTLKSNIDTCIKRNNERDKKMSDNSIIAVYDLVKVFDYGINIDTDSKSKEDIIKEIMGYIE